MKIAQERSLTQKEGALVAVLPKGLDSKTCDLILDSVGGFKKSIINSEKGSKTGFFQPYVVRKVQTFFDNQQWVYDSIWSIMEGANKAAEWEFEIESAEPYQISKYEIGEFYSWHLDSLGTQGTKYIDKTKPHLDGKTRKISMSLTLNDDFEGGDLVIWQQGKVKQEKGSLIFFPSFLPHQVTPVTKGTRYSLVMWFLGKPWR